MVSTIEPRHADYQNHQPELPHLVTAERLILVVDDEPQIRRAVANALEPLPVRVIEAATGRGGIDLAAAEHPDLIVLDLGLPDLDGAQVCREIRKWSAATILVLSARHSDHEKVQLLDGGADDYVTKPFSTSELRARVGAHLRRAEKQEEREEPAKSFGSLKVDPARRVISRNGVAIHLTPTEWDLLRTFLRHPGRTLTHQQLFREVWNQGSGDPQQYLRVYVANLRRKIEADSLRPKLIITEPGVGYRFDTDV